MNASCQELKRFRLIDMHPNCSELAVHIFGHVIPVLAVFVVMLNIPMLIVFTRPHVRSHTTFILSLIACADILDIICPTVVLVYQYSLGHSNEFLLYSHCQWTYILLYVSVDTFNMISLWLTVLLAYIRCKCLQSPFLARHIHSGKRIIMYVLGILSLAMLVHLPSFFLFDFTPVKTIDTFTNSTMELCRIVEPDGAVLKSCMRRKIQIFTKTVVDSIVPCFFLVYYNFVILLTLRKARRSRTSLRRSESTSYNITKIQACETLVQVENVKLRQISIYKTASTELEGVSNESNGAWSTNSTQVAERNKCESPVLDRNDANNTDSHGIRMCCLNEGKSFRKKANSTDCVLDKLDQECKRTSWLIFVISTIVVVNEVPLAAENVYTLATYAGSPLPMNIYGCFSIILELFQFITYPMIFIIYASMSRAFRVELCTTIMHPCKQRGITPNDTNRLFLCPCVVQQTSSRCCEPIADLPCTNHSDKDNSFDMNMTKANTCM